MTDQTPVERAARAVLTAPGSNTEPPAETIARAAFEAIDTDQLAHVIFSTPHGGNGKAAADIALAVKNWLTGKDTQ